MVAISIVITLGLWLTLLLFFRTTSALADFSLPPVLLPAGRAQAFLIKMRNELLTRKILGHIFRHIGK